MSAESQTRSCNILGIFRPGGKYLDVIVTHLDDDEPLKQSMLSAARILHSRSILDPLII